MGRRDAARRRQPEAVRITSAPVSRKDELAHRQRRYVISMTIRTLCFIGAVVAHGWLRWVLIAAAFILPYVAVVMANKADPMVDAEDPERPGPTAGSDFRQLGGSSRQDGDEAPDFSTPDPPPPGSSGQVPGDPPPWSSGTAPSSPPEVEPVPREPERICSARGCREAAVHELRWNNPKLHTPDRRKVWLACDEHLGSLADFLAARGFLREVAHH